MPREKEILTIDPKFKKTDFCLKCQTKENLTHHHVIPKSHKKHENTETDKVTLCRKCHDKLEYYILSVESFMGGVSFGRRYKLNFKSYYIALVNFLGVERCADIIRKQVININNKRRRAKNLFDD